jgi:hypothetical protein
MPELSRRDSIALTGATASSVWFTAEARDILAAGKHAATAQRFEALSAADAARHRGGNGADRCNRSHDVKNLFVVDGSSLVTGGRGQPTMTIQALAFRAGENIAKFAKQMDV